MSGTSQNVEQACAYLSSALLSPDHSRSFTQSVKDKCEKLKQLVSSRERGPI